MTKRVRLAYLVSHPIQYQAPLLRRIALEPDIDLTVFFGSDFSVRGYRDIGFNTGIEWDVPLLDGYEYEFLPTIRDQRRTGVATQIAYGIFSRLRNSDNPKFDALWVHGYSTVNTLQGIFAANLLGIPVLLRAESWLMARKESWAKRVYFRLFKNMVDATLSIGTRNAAYWQHYFGEDIPDFSMPYAVDNDYFQSFSVKAKTEREQLRAELGLDASRPVILFASKLQKRKCCSDLVAAYIKLSSRADLSPLPYLVIVGDGEERDALQAQAKASGLEGIRFCGFRNQSELPGFFDLASVFVLPSRNEAWGLIVNEVMNAARPVIVSDEVGCGPDLITEGVEGHIFPAGDIDALAKALHTVISMPEVAIEMGQRALQRIQNWNFEADIRGLRAAIAATTGKLEA